MRFLFRVFYDYHEEWIKRLWKQSNEILEIKTIDQYLVMFIKYCDFFVIGYGLLRPMALSLFGSLP